MSETETSNTNFHLGKGRLVITSDGIKQLKAYKYKSGAYTPIDNLLNKYVWTPAIELVPMSVAPNMITLFGLFWVVLSFYVLTAFVPTFEGEAPSWAYAFAGLSLVSIYTYKTYDVSYIYFNWRCNFHFNSRFIQLEQSVVYVFLKTKLKI